MTPMIAPGRPPSESRQSTDPCTVRLLDVGNHRDDSGHEREQQIGADRLIGAYAQKNEQRRRDSAGADAAVRGAGAHDESDEDEVPIHIMPSHYLDEFDGFATGT